ncbi:MAG: glycine--tRNA ligase subunit beta [Acidobacteria bacterium]|nr:glycine--tRNA ligase subunit beta [Acidobacteriota bacterium]
MAEFLLEIGCEEIPAGWLPGLTQQLRERFLEVAEREHLDPTAVASDSTPRRLVLRADVAARQADREEPVWGPAVEAAKDASGAWTKAAEGFARKCGVSPEALQQGVKDAARPGDQYLLYVRRTEGRSTREILPGVIAGVLRALAFPKRMSWDAWIEDGKGSFVFGRPIRWMVALMDGAVVPFAIHALAEGRRADPVVTSGDTTWGHRFLPREAAGRPIRVRSGADLREKLRAACVLLDPTEREKRILDGLASVAGPAPPDDHGLPVEWRDLVEYPTVVVGKIPAQLRSLPTEVLETVLVHHQKYVPLGEGRVVSRFAAVTNTDGSNADEIVRGMERVVVARLRDAAFFYQEDVKRPLADRVGDLAGVVFHKGLGTYKDKSDRMVRLVDAMGAEMGLLTKPEHEAAREAARLAKADLTTLMVREFPELQGVMGGIYLRAQGHPWPNVSVAVQWHYHPVSVEEGSPPARAVAGGDATVFGAVSVADKLDTLAGYFGLGLEPTGSSDPFGLRRAAQGVVRVLLDFWSADAAERRPNLVQLVGAAVEGYGDTIADSASAKLRLAAFLSDRLRYVLAARGYPGDEVEAVLGAREPEALQDPHEAWVRLRALHSVRSEARVDFEHLAVAFKRAKNILGSGAGASVDPALFQEAAEGELHAAVGRLEVRDGGYEARLRALAGLRAPVDRFFDDVLVMAEDPRLRANRLGLLSRTLSLFYRIADISKLGG